MEVIKALIEGITQDLIAYLVEDKSIAIEEAMSIVYGSIIFKKLSSSDTGLYRESSAYVYELLKDELKDGSVVQKEI